MDYDSSNKFISSLAKFLQSLCNGYVEFDNGVQVIGHLYLSVDTGKTIDYILNEKVCKTDENSVTFISNSFHAQPAEKPKSPPKRGGKDNKSEDLTSESDEPRSTNNGTVPSIRNSGQNSPHTGIKRPHSPSQRQSPHSKSGRSSPKYRKGVSDSLDQSASHPSNPASENSISSAPSPAVEGGPPSSAQGLGYNEPYSDSYFAAGDEDSAIEESDRDVKPSLDTDVTFIKEEYGANSGGQGRDANSEDQTVFSSNQAYSSMQYSGQFGSSYGGQRSALNPSGDRSSNMYSSQGSSHLETGEGAGDPSVRQMVQLEEINPLDTHDDSLVSSLCGIQKPVKMEPGVKKTPPKWGERARKYSCHFCWKSFVVKRDWEGHINSVHLKTKPYRCHICSWSSAHRMFTRPLFRGMAQIRFHDHDKEDINNFLVGKMASEYGTDPKRYSCIKCNQTFSFPGNLTRHRKACEGNFDKKCMYCDRVFYRQDVLKVHVQRKHGFIITPRPLV